MTDVTSLPRIAAIVLLTVTGAACAARGGAGNVPRPFPGASVPPAGHETPPERINPVPDRADDVPSASLSEESATGFTSLVDTALDYLGVPYRNGGSDPSGFDCSGFVQWVFAKLGVALPREVKDQYEVGEKISLTKVRAGDLLFFETVRRGASHVGMALGDGRFVHAPSSNGVVRIEHYTSYWASRFVGARRIEDVKDDSQSASNTGGIILPGSVRSSR